MKVGRFSTSDGGIQIEFLEALQGEGDHSVAGFVVEQNEDEAEE